MPSTVHRRDRWRCTSSPSLHTSSAKHDGVEALLEIADPPLTTTTVSRAGIADIELVTTLCPGGKERMRRLMALVQRGRLDLTPLLTHRFPLDRIGEAYDLFANRRDGVLKVAITP